MAQRRMISLKVIDTDEFLDMPPTTQNLYFHLCMRADDDGFVSSPKKITKIINSASDDMKVLIGKSFIIPFDSGVCVIKHWRVHNLIRQDRYTETEYKEEKKLLTEQDNKYELENVIPNGNQMEPQVRLGKVSIDKVRKDKVNKLGLAKPTISKRKKISFKKSEMDKVCVAYSKIRGISIQGNEWLPIQQAIKTMFMSNRSVDEIIGCMKWLASGEQEWMENWTINTVKMKLPFYKKTSEDIKIPEYAREYQNKYEKLNKK